MNFTVRKRPTRGCVLTSEAALNARYPHSISMYRQPPTDDISLREFEQAAIDRVRGLRALLSASVCTGLHPNSKEWRDAAISHLKKAGMKDMDRPPSSPAARRLDHIAHFALRLAYCRSEDLRRWFLARELELFRLRFSQLKSQEEKESFLKFEGFRYEHISEEQKSQLALQLADSTMKNFSHAKVMTTEFYRVRFVEALDMIKNRKVYVEKGYAYIPSDDFVSVLCSRFRSELNHALNIASKRLPELEIDQRLVLLLKGLHNSYSGNDYTTSKSAVPIESLDSLSLKAFPLCMRSLHESLRANHHLKHGGRLQYGLFLKAIGVVYEDAMKFWREEFTKKMDLNKFEKNYSYNIRYNYGMEGSKKNYSAYNCMKIIQGNMGAQDSHGCPFKHSDPVNLKNRLSAYGVDSIGILIECFVSLYMSFLYH